MTIRVGMVGMGEMGLSYSAIVNMHPNVELIAISGASNFILKIFSKYLGVLCFKEYREMIKKCNLDCVVVTTPIDSHAEIVKHALEKNLHVFVEQPLCLEVEQGKELVDMANHKRLVNQVGYPCRFCGVFQKTKALLEKGVLGEIYHFDAQAFGPRLVRSGYWKRKKSERELCLCGNISHCLDLIDYLIGPPDRVAGTVWRKINSELSKNAVYSTLLYANGLSGALEVNWANPNYLKMSNKIIVWGSKGKIVADRQECRIFLQNRDEENNLNKGWNIINTTDLTRPVNYFLRGEEYTAQFDHFFSCVALKSMNNISPFNSALRSVALVERLIGPGETRSTMDG